LHGDHPKGDTNMPDNKQDRGQQDRNRIDVHEDYELRYWTKELGVTSDELKSAVQKVGPSAKAVREHLGKL
jgi:hypothetical protein